MKIQKIKSELLKSLSKVTHYTLIILYEKYEYKKNQLQDNLSTSRELESLFTHG